MSKMKKLDKADGKEDDLRNLLELYMQRSEELENRESRVLKQVELMQSAVASLQAWNESRKSMSQSQPVNVKVGEIEEETRKIKEETMRIQQEVKQKTEENKRLQEEIDKRRKSERGQMNDPISDIIQKMDQQVGRRRIERMEIESRGTKASAPLQDDRGIQFFDQKLNKLKETEKKVKKESKQDEEMTKLKNKNLKEKLEVLELETEMDKQAIQVLKKKYGKK